MKQMDHHPYHERRLEQQMLDALLRIEAILERAFPEAPLERFVTDRGNYEDRIAPEGKIKPKGRK